MHDYWLWPLPPSGNNCVQEPFPIRIFSPNYAAHEAFKGSILTISCLIKGYSYPITKQVRAIHQTVQFLGVGFLLLGLLFILAQKIEVRHSIVPHSIHSLLAVSVLVAVLIQAVVGQEKLQHHQLMKTNRKIRRWHGDMGLLLWDALCLTLITGLLAFLPFSIASYLVLPFPVVLWLAVIMQMIGKNAVKDEELDWGSGEYSAVGDITYDANVTPANAGDEESAVGLLAQQTHHRRSSANLTAHDEYTIQRESSTGGGELTPSSAGELYLQDDDDDF